MNKYKNKLSTKRIKKHTLLTAYDNCDKLTLLEWLKLIEKEIEAVTITKDHEGEGIKLTFDEDEHLLKISVNEHVAQYDKNGVFSALQTFIHNSGIKVADSSQLNYALYGINNIKYHRIDGYDFTYTLPNKSGTFALLDDLLNKQDKITPSFEGDNIILEFDGSGKLIKINARAETPQDVVSKTGYDIITGFKIFENNDGIAIRNEGDLPSRQTYYGKTAITYNTGSEHVLPFNRIILRDEMTSYVTEQIAPKQNKQDNNLQTLSKNIVGAINEVNAKAEGGEDAYVISTANGKNPNFLSDDYDITATQIELQDGTIIPISDIRVGKTIYVLEESVSDRWYSGEGHFIRLREKIILDDYQRKDTLDADVEALGYIKESGLEAKVTALGFIKNNELDSLVSGLGFIKGITYSDILDNLGGSKFISVDYNSTTEKAEVEFDFTNIDEFIPFADGQEIVASWTSGIDKKLQLNLKQELSNKIANSLQLPTTHTEDTLVGVGTNGAQRQLGLDSETLEIENNKLKAKIPTPQEIHLYEHIVTVLSTPITGAIYLSVYKTNNTPLVSRELLSLYGNGGNLPLIGGMVFIDNVYYPVTQASISEENPVVIVTIYYLKDGLENELELSSPGVSTNRIRQII